MSLINFELKQLSEIMPWGTEPNTRMHWFGLTDGHYWLSIGETTLYQYTHEIAHSWGLKSTRYTDYFIVRFLEDLTQLFPRIAEPIPEDLYQMVQSQFSLYDFYGKATLWLENLQDDEAVDDDLYYDRYDKIIEWIYSRTLTAMHLNCGPEIFFFRSDDKISIIWRCDHKSEDGISVWTAGNGQIEMLFDDFIKEIKSWGELFFASMEVQVGKAIAQEWGNTEIDKDRLRVEQEERRRDFIDSIETLNQTNNKADDWILIRELIKELSASTAVEDPVNK